jgi:hypothetical protein
MTNGDGRSWKHTVQVGVTALLASAVMIGLVVGVAVTVVAKVGGLGETSQTGSDPQTLYLPRYSHTPTESTAPDAEDSGTPKVSISAVPLDPTDTTTEVGEITLYANPTSAGLNEKITLSGVYLDGEGVELQVQRQDGDAWVNFPTKAHVANGSFSTYVYTGRAGANNFRMFDPTTGRSSNSVTVTVG